MAPAGDQVSAYAALVHHLARTSTNYKGLNDFLNIKEHSTQAPTKFTVVELPSDNPAFKANQINEFVGAARLTQALDQPDIKHSCRFFKSRTSARKQYVYLGSVSTLTLSSLRIT